MTDYSPIEAYSLVELFDNAIDGVFVSDGAGRYLYVNPAGAALLGYGPHELIGASVDEVIDIEDAPRVTAWRDSNPVDPQRGEWRLRRRDGSWIEVEISSRVLADGRWFGTVRDITERKAREARMRLLAREVDHRANNLMAVVQGAVSLSQADSVPELKQVLIGRITALARAHQLLADGRWEGADLRRLVEDELQPFATPGDGRLTVEGEPFALAPQVAQSVAMAVHELTTNAVKHGALSVEGGRVAVAWTPPGGAEAPMIVWRESGGPPVVEPARRGLGATLLERALLGVRGGRTEIEWREEGVICRLWLG
jgi:PAS domain S-box-containing protein